MFQFDFASGMPSLSGIEKEVPTEEAVLYQIKSMLRLNVGASPPKKEVGKRVRSYTRDYLLWCSGYEASQMFPPELAAQIDAFPDVIKPYGHSVTLDPQDLFSPEKTTRSRKEVARRREVFFDLNGVQIDDPAFGLNEGSALLDSGRDGRPGRRQKIQPLLDYPLEFVSVGHAFAGRRRRGKL